MVLPAGIVRSAATEQRLFAARRNRVTLFRRPRREYKRDRVCVSIPGENGTPGGNRKERSDGTAIVRRKAQSRHVISAAPTGVQKRPGMRQHTRRKWYSRRESNPQRPLRRGLLYPFNYGSVLNFIARGRNHCRKKFYTKIYTSFFPPRENKHKSSGFARKTCVLGNILWIEQYLRRGLLYPFNYGSI